MVGLDVMPRTPSSSHFGQLAAVDPVAAQVVEPGALPADGVEVLESGHRDNSLRRCRLSLVLAAHRARASAGAPRQQRAGPLDDVVRREAELLHDDVPGRRGAEVVDADGVVGVALPPEAWRRPRCSGPARPPGTRWRGSRRAAARSGPSSGTDTTRARTPVGAERGRRGRRSAGPRCRVPTRTMSGGPSGSAST